MKHIRSIACPRCVRQDRNASRYLETKGQLHGDGGFGKDDPHGHTEDRAHKAVTMAGRSDRGRSFSLKPQRPLPSPRRRTPRVSLAPGMCGLVARNERNVLVERRQSNYDICLEYRAGADG